MGQAQLSAKTKLVLRTQNGLQGKSVGGKVIARGANAAARYCRVIASATLTKCVVEGAA